MARTRDVPDARPRDRLAGGIRALAVATAVTMTLLACTGEAAPPGGTAPPSEDPVAADVGASPGMDPAAMATPDPEGLCKRIDELELSVARLRGVELKLVNRVALDIELDNVQLAFGELYASDLGAFEEELETPLRRLFYRLGELELAVEDFRTSSRLRRAVPHVEQDANTFAGDLAAFRVLARC